MNDSVLNMNQPRAITVRELRALNGYEYGALETALREYIARHGGKKSWPQAALLEMLPLMMWGSK